MIVTIVADVLGKANNGTTIAAINLMRTLMAKGHTVRCICPDSDKKGAKNYYVMPTLSFGPFQTIVDHNQVVLAKPDKMEMGRAIKGSDIVHIMMPFTLGRAAIKYCKKFGIPVSAGFHVQAENVTAHFFNLMKSQTANRLVYKDFWSHFYKHVDAIHYPTNFIRKTFEEAVGEKTNGYVISNGVNTQFKRETVEKSEEFKGKFVIVCTGRFSKEKRQKLLVKAVSKLPYKDDVRILFAGSGPREEWYKKYAKKMGVDAIFRFYSREELVHALNMSDLYVHTSEIEIEAISCLEAISAGLVPVINNSPLSATREFALSELNLFDKSDSDSLADRIDYWYKHPEEREKMSNEYLSFSGRFGFEACMDEMEKMLLEVVEQEAKKRNG